MISRRPVASGSCREGNKKCRTVLKWHEYRRAENTPGHDGFTTASLDWHRRHPTLVRSLDDVYSIRVACFSPLLVFLRLFSLSFSHSDSFFFFFFVFFRYNKAPNISFLVRRGEEKAASSLARIQAELLLAPFVSAGSGGCGGCWPINTFCSSRFLISGPRLALSLSVSILQSRVGASPTPAVASVVAA